jgi:hypothetical protein
MLPTVAGYCVRVRVKLGSAPIRESRKPQPLELRFCALLTEGGARRLELKSS